LATFGEFFGNLVYTQYSGKIANTWTRAPTILRDQPVDIAAGIEFKHDINVGFNFTDSDSYKGTRNMAFNDSLLNQISVTKSHFHLKTKLGVEEYKLAKTDAAAFAKTFELRFGALVEGTIRSANIHATGSGFGEICQVPVGQGKALVDTPYSGDLTAINKMTLPSIAGHVFSTGSNNTGSLFNFTSNQYPWSAKIVANCMVISLQPNLRAHTVDVYFTSDAVATVPDSAWVTKISLSQEYAVGTPNYPIGLRGAAALFKNRNSDAGIQTYLADPIKYYGLNRAKDPDKLCSHMLDIQPGETNKDTLLAATSILMDYTPGSNEYVIMLSTARQAKIIQENELNRLEIINAASVTDKQGLTMAKGSQSNSYQYMTVMLSDTVVTPFWGDDEFLIYRKEDFRRVAYDGNISAMLNGVLADNEAGRSDLLKSGPEGQLLNGPNGMNIDDTFDISDNGGDDRQASRDLILTYYGNNYLLNPANVICGFFSDHLDGTPNT
jgi:hypothetical protein